MDDTGKPACCGRSSLAEIGGAGRAAGKHVGEGRGLDRRAEGSQGVALPSRLFFHLEPGGGESLAGCWQLFTLIKPAVLNLCVGSGSASPFP